MTQICFVSKVELKFYDFVFDLDQINAVEKSSEHYVFNLLKAINFFEIRVEMKLPETNEEIESKMEMQDYLHRIILLSGFDKYIWPKNEFHIMKNIVV